MAESDTYDSPVNIAQMLKGNAVRFSGKEIFFEQDTAGEYKGIYWKDLYENILNIAFNLKAAGMQKGDKIILFSRNCLRMLEAELAIMASGGIAVPIFSNFKKDTAELLIRHSDACWLIAAGKQQLEQLSENLPLKRIWTFDYQENSRFSNLAPFSELERRREDLDFALNTGASPDETCLNMYTSGTMGIPKCVQLSHRNILSQQVAIGQVLKISENDRFLSYLPWHHSFGGIFELFSALYNGAPFYVESSFGKDASQIFQNWKKVRPTVFFSVPKVYQSLFELVAKNKKEAEEILFGSGLRFIFTAASALPERLSAQFESRGIPVIEGWGLTETSPCCTLTDPSLRREPGLVGKPIPGVSIRIADDDEIQVKGPNVMSGYYKNDEANAEAFTDDGWYRTGDVGVMTVNGLKLISRKDRIFKLSNGEKVVPSDLEKAIELKCHYVQYAIVAGSGEEYPVALIFPNRKMLEQPDYEISPEQGCFCPRSLNELGRCLSGCLAVANESIGQKFAKAKSAAIILDELSLDDRTLTPSMKVAPKNVIEKYRAHLRNLYGEHVPTEEEVFIIELDPKKRTERCTE